MCNRCHNELMEAFLAVPDIDSFNTRTALLAGIPDSQSLKRDSSNTSTDLSLLVEALASLKSGSGEGLLKIFVDNVKSRVKNLALSEQLEKLFQQYEQCLSNSQKQAPDPKNPGSSEKAASSSGPEISSGAEHKKSTVPNGDPDLRVSLAVHRKAVEEIEHTLAVTAPHRLTVSILNTYMDTILAVLSALRTQTITEEAVLSRDAVLSGMFEARDALSMAISGKWKGTTPTYVKNLASCRQNLEQALRYW